MWKTSTNALALLACLALGACASSPTGPGAEKPPVKVDARAKTEFSQAIQALKDKRDDEALHLLTGLTRKYPNLAGPFTNLGLLYIKQDKLEQARQALLQATTVRPDDAVAFNELGVVYRKLGKFKQAQQAYQQALKLKPDYADAHLNIGILYDVYLNDLPRALSHYEKYQRLSSNPDKLVAKWILDLKRRVKKQQAKVTS
ncbi:MAG: tetratricopeptide repeat protein [Gammaproteobacteria bacterium]